MTAHKTIKSAKSMKSVKPAKSEHFSFEPLAKGVYVALDTGKGGAGCNAGIIALGRSHLILDTGATLTAARELRAAGASLTGTPVAYVINSHDHPDHVLGNIVFEGAATLIAASGTREAMVESGLTMMEGFRQQISQAIRHAEEGLAKVGRGGEDAAGGGQTAHVDALRAELTIGRAYMAGYPAPEDYRLPQVSFQGEMVFHGAPALRLIDCGEAHSACDSVLYLPDEGILFIGDLITEGNLILRYGSPERWLKVLDRLEALGASTIVPGHGPVMPAGPAFAAARQYIHEILGVAERAVASGAVADQIPVPEGLGPYWYRDNIRFLLRRAAGS